MKKLLITISLILTNLVALSDEVPQKIKREVIGQINPFSNEIYTQLDNIQEDLKVVDEQNKEIKYELKNNLLKISYGNTSKPMKITIHNGAEELVVNEVYPKSQISEKAYREGNFTVFELDNSYLYNANKIERGEYTTVNKTGEVFLDFKAFSQPYTPIIKNENAITGKVNIDIYDYNGNKIESEEIKVYEETEKLDIPQKEIYHKKFEEPVKVRIRWDFQLGSYKTYIYDKEMDISFIKNINLKLRFKDVKYEVYEEVKETNENIEEDGQLAEEIGIDIYAEPIEDVDEEK